MRTFNDAFMEAIVNAGSADIRFTIEVQWDEAGTELVYFLSHSDSGSPVGATTIHSIHSISSTSQSLNNRYAIAEIGSLTFTLADVGDAITTELASRFDSGITAVKKKCTVYMGTQDLDWTDYEPIDTWFIDDIDHTGPGYKFRASDVQRLLRQKIFTPDKSRLSASMTASQTHIPLTVALSSTLFQAVAHDSSYTFNPSVSVGYVKIDDEIIAHDGTFTNHATDGPSLGVVTRGALNTVAAAHSTDENADEDKGKEVTEIIYIEGKVVDLAHLIMTGENIAGTVTIPDHWNPGIDTDFIDADTFSDINTELLDRRMRFIGEKEQDAKQFIEQQLMRFYGLFQVVTSQGKLKLQRYERTIEETAPVAYISDEQLIDIGDLSQRAQDVINFYNIDFNWDYLSERSTRNLRFLDSSSYTANGRLIKKESFDFRGVHTALHSDNDIRNFIYQTRELYSNPPFRTRIKVTRELIGVEVGDVVNVETSIRKDYVTGVTTLNRPFLVNRRSVDLNSGEVSLELIGTGLKAEAILDPGAVGSTGELDTSYLTGTGTNLESLTEVTSGTVTTDLTLTGTSDITASGSIWYLDGNLVIPNGVTLTLVNNAQLRVTGEIVVQNGGKIDAKGNGLSGGVFGGVAVTAGYLGTTKAGVGEQQAPTAYWYTNLDFGVIKRLPDPSPIIGQVQSVPFFNLRNEDGTLTGLPGDLRGTPGGPGGGSVGDTAGDGGNGGNGGAGFISISRGFTVEATGVVDLSGNNGTAGEEPTLSYPGGSTKAYAGGGGGGCPGGWLCIIDGAFSAPTSDQVTANRGQEINSTPRTHNKTGFTSLDMAAAAFRVQYVPASKVIADDGTTGVIQLGQVTGVSVDSGAEYILIHDNGSVTERALVTWSILSDSAVVGYQLQAKRSADPDWITQALTEGADDVSAFFPVQDGTQYDVRVRAFGENVVPGDWSTTVQHTAVGASELDAIDPPANVAANSGTSQLLELSDGTIVERILVTWNASVDPLWTGTEVEFKKSADSDWQDAALINSPNVLRAYIIGEGGTNYDIRLRHLSRTRPNSSYTTVSAHTLVGETAPPSDVTNFRVSQNGELVNFFHDLISDADRDGYLYRYGPAGVTWENAIPLNNESKGTAVSAAYVPPGTWDFLCKAIDRSKNVSTTAARASLTLTTSYNVISEVQHDPGWKNGTVSGYWVHYTGVLVPQDQNAASTYGYEMFDEVVPNAVAESSFTSDEQDGLVEAVMRIWADVDSVLAQGESGIANPQLSIDYRTEAGSYDGYEDWSIGQVTARYAKFKITNDNTEGVVIVQGLKTVLDAQERTEKAQGVTVAAGGTAITFDTEFRETPFIRVFTQAGSGLIPDSAGDSTTGFTFHIYNSAGSSVGGTGKWEAQGI